MPTPTHDLIASSVLGSSASTVTFSSIPGTYRDLVLVVDVTSTGTLTWVRVRPNDYFGSMSYILASTYNNGPYTEQTLSTEGYAIGTTVYFDNTNRLQGTLQIFDYATTDKAKPALSRGSNPARAVEMLAGRYPETTAITSLVIVAPGGASFATGSRFHLYGIVS